MRATIYGRITTDLALNEKDYVSFQLANQTSKNTTNFINCKAFGKTAQNLCKYLKKGQRVVLEAEYIQDEYNGNKRHDWIVNNFDFVETRQETHQAPQQTKKEQVAPAQEVNADDLPW